MARPKPKSRQKQMDLKLKDKKRILKLYDKLPSMSQRRAAMILNVSQPRLCTILRNRSYIENTSVRKGAKSRKTDRSEKDKQVESALKIWFTYVRERECPGNNAAFMRKKAEHFAHILGKKNFTASRGWFYRWKKRENILFKNVSKEKKRCVESMAEDPLPADEWIATEWPDIANHYPPQSIYFAFETGLYYSAMPECALFIKNESVKDFTSRDRVTILYCVNMVGEKKDLLVIGKRKNPRWQRDVKKLPLEYYYNANAWMTSADFVNWLTEWNQSLDRKVVLIVNHCTVHMNVLPLKNIKIVLAPSEITFSVDQEVMRALKCHYRMRILSDILPHLYESQYSCDAETMAKKISLLNAMHFLVMAWREISSRTIQIIFQKCGFLEVRSEDPPTFDEPAINIPGVMSEIDFETWVNMDNNVEVAAPPIPLSLLNQENREVEEHEWADEELSEIPPTDTEMIEALRVLRRGVQYRASNFDKQYDYEYYIHELMTPNLKYVSECAG